MDVIAQVVLRGPDGSSILEASQPITAATIAKHRIGTETIQRASIALENLGVKVLAPGPTGLTYPAAAPCSNEYSTPSCKKIS
jgi:hypothetical protein